MGCPTTQKVHQKKAFPMKELSNRRSRYLARKINGAWANIPKKAWKEICWNGKEITNSCNNAEKKKTTKVATILEHFQRISG
jgi:tRNA U34 2-thiouridine synthase MnmA/TrmU